MKDFIQVNTTTENKEQAQQIAAMLVQKKLAACVQVVGPIVSTYAWKGKVETAQEWLCLIKTAKSLFAEMEKAIQAEHTYETPEIIATPVLAGSKDYLNWLASEIKSP